MSLKIREFLQSVASKAIFHCFDVILKVLTLGGAGVLRILNSDGSLSSISPLQNQTIRVLNSDGTLTSLTDAVGSNIRFVTADGSMVTIFLGHSFSRYL